MGTTATRLHLFQTVERADAFSGDLTKAYASLGYAPAEKVGDEPVKKVLLAGGRNRFLSIHDSDNAALDTGELKDLAVSLSKRHKTIAVLTSVYDSDQFEFILFHKGKQIDAILSDIDDRGEPPKILSPKRRIAKWTELFLSPVPAGPEPGPTFGDARAAFAERFERAQQTNGAFADDSLAAWCAVIGLDPALALNSDADLAATDGPGAAALAFRKIPGAGPGGAMAPGDASAEPAVTLLAYRADDDCPHLRYYPAAWPIPADESQNLSWLAVSTAAGFSGLRVMLEIDDPTAARIETVTVHAHPFYNGQITSMTPIASAEISPPPDLASSWHVDDTGFAIPDLDKETRKQIVLVIRIHVSSLGDKTFTIRPSITALSPAADPLNLPPLTLRPKRPSWVPRVFDASTPDRDEAILRLNEPSVVSMVALLDDDGAGVRSAVRELSESLIESMSLPTGTQLAVRTQKHMSPTSFNVSKSAKSLDILAARDDRLWPKLFDVKNNYQTVTMGIESPGASQPMAGITFQSALRDDPDHEKAAKAHLRETVEKHLPADLRTDALADWCHGTTLNVAVWSLNAPDVFERLGLSSGQLTSLFENWLLPQQPVQAWRAEAAWIPEFDLYDEYRSTLYEESSGLDWFRSGLNGMLASRAWAARRLRFIAPLMWLHDDLTRPVDLPLVQQVADTDRTGSTLRIELRPDKSLEDLERMLDPLLPGPSRG